MGLVTDQEDPAYPRNAGVPELLRSVVAFVDLLGTSEHASEESAQETLEKLDASLRRARDQSGIDEALSWFHASWFSDNLSICAPLPQPRRQGDRSFEESSLGFVTVMWLQFRLAIDGFVLRGGITVGPQFADRDVNFGPALVEAVALEKGAKYPRVVVDDLTLEVVDDHFGDYFTLSENPFHLELMRAPDGRVFVSYLAAVFEADDPEEAHEMLNRHRAAVAALISGIRIRPTESERSTAGWRRTTTASAHGSLRTALTSRWQAARPTRCSFHTSPDGGSCDQTAGLR